MPVLQPSRVVTLPEVYVHEAVIGHMRDLPACPCEVGGWLLGYWGEDRASLLVTAATPPASRGTPFGVRISAAGHQHRFDQAWQASGGLVTFLGDWHTHPGSPPYPSARDEAALVKLATGVKFGTPEPLIAIVSTPRYPWRQGSVTIGFYLGGGEESARSVEAHVTSELPAVALGVPAWRWPRDRARRGRPGARL
ncbi:MAG: Mov34/MPN/PAD-1 family protein [Terriglobales bacterium]